MSRALSSSEIMSALARAGFVQISTLTVIVKHPAKDVPKGTVSSILKQAGMSREEFERFL